VSIIAGHGEQKLATLLLSKGIGLGSNFGEFLLFFLSIPFSAFSSSLFSLYKYLFKILFISKKRQLVDE